MMSIFFLFSWHIIINSAILIDFNLMQYPVLKIELLKKKINKTTTVFFPKIAKGEIHIYIYQGGGV